ncbi:MAG TPA: hypothetical protein VJT79_01555, partial [Pseudonocardia sp.]|nr:hypothetical protein [Pseudonocardia sp.]
MLDRAAAAAAARIVRLGRSVRSGGRCLVKESTGGAVASTVGSRTGGVVSSAVGDGVGGPGFGGVGGRLGGGVA